MLRLAGVNAVAVAAFGLVYTLAGKRVMAVGPFWAALGVVFVASAALWVRLESQQGRRRDLLSRVGRIVIGLVIPVVATPAVLLTPLFFLLEQLPGEAGVAEIIGRVMFLLLTSLTLMILVNAAGIAIMVVEALWRRWRRRQAHPAE